MDDCIELPAEITSEKECSNYGKFLYEQIILVLEKANYDKNRTLTIVLGPFKEVCPLCGKIHY